MDKVQDFRSLDFGSIANPVAQQEITVVVDPDVMVVDYGRAFFHECERINPAMIDRVGLTEQECADYCVYILGKRIQSIDGECSDWRKLKNLWIPSFVQYSISMIGKVNMREMGLVITPTLKEGVDILTYEEALAISNKMSYFERDVNIVLDAMPRDEKGEASVMGTAIIAGYVKAIKKVEHIADTYIATFLGFKIKEETAMSVLYRTQYDDVDYIISALNSRRLY